MPLCGCFHSYTLTRLSEEYFRLQLPTGPLGNFAEVLRNSRLADSVVENTSTSLTLPFKKTFMLKRVREEGSLRRLLETLKSKIIVDLSPDLSQCYSLGPYSVVGEDGRVNVRSPWGDLIYRAKYRSDPDANRQILSRIEEFIEGHLAIRTINSIIAPPKSDSNTPDLAGSWANQIAGRLGARRLNALKVREGIGPQKNLLMSLSEEDLVGRLANSVTIREAVADARVLILDDTIGSGGTLKEMARALRDGGARQIYGLTVAKDAKFTLGGVDLKEELWK